VVGPRGLALLSKGKLNGIRVYCTDVWYSLTALGIGCMVPYGCEPERESMTSLIRPRGFLDSFFLLIKRDIDMGQISPIQFCIFLTRKER